MKVQIQLFITSLILCSLLYGCELQEEHQGDYIFINGDGNTVEVYHGTTNLLAVVSGEICDTCNGLNFADCEECNGTGKQKE